jgi:ubiquitin
MPKPDQKTAQKLIEFSSRAIDSELTVKNSTKIKIRA